MIKLTAQGKFIDTKEMKYLLTQGEKCSDLIHLVVDAKNNDVDIKDCIFVLRTVASEGSMTETILPKTVMNEQILLMWKVPYTATAVPGMLRLELIGTKAEETIIKFKMPPIYVKDAVMGSNVPVPDVVDEKLLQMTELLKQALDIGDKLSSESGILKEVIDARKGAFDDYTYSSLSQRLEREFNLCVQRSFLEIALRAAIEEANDLGVGRFWKDNNGEIKGEIFGDYENNLARSQFAHAEGGNTQANGICSHAEGSGTQSDVQYAHSEGYRSRASGKASHSEGSTTLASGNYSHAEGLGTYALSECQHTSGKYNLLDSSEKYVYIIGNGTDKTRSNALTLDWNGNLWLSGDVTATGTDGKEISLNSLSAAIGSIQTALAEIVEVTA